MLAITLVFRHRNVTAISKESLDDKLTGLVQRTISYQAENVMIWQSDDDGSTAVEMMDTVPLLEAAMIHFHLAPFLIRASPP